MVSPAQRVPDEQTNGAVPPPKQRSLLSMYCAAELALLDRKMRAFSALPPDDQQLLTEYSERLQAVGSRINANGKFLQILAQHGEQFLAMRAPDDDADDEHDDDDEADEIAALFHSVARDWSEHGAPVRHALYQPLIDAIQSAYTDATSAYVDLARDNFRVLVPHAGSGRLCYELARLGFAVEGCEASPALLAASNYLLNHAKCSAALDIYPYASVHSNQRSASAQLAAVSVPDVTASELEARSEFGMRVGRFLDVYAEQEAVADAVVSCVDIEADENSAAIVRLVSQLLRPGGVWVFLGPMPMPRDDSSLAVTLSIPEFTSLVKRGGFKILNEKTLEVPLSMEPDNSLRRRAMNAKLFVAMKVRPMK